MKTFGEYNIKSREDKVLPLRKVAVALDIDTSVLGKIERNERRATIEIETNIAPEIVITETFID